MDVDVERRIADAIRTDEFYQELLRQCCELGEDYRRIRANLPGEDQEKLEAYICLCEEMEYQRTRMAYAIGTQDGLRTGTAKFGVK